jgi:phosphate:Na+ symporter
MVLLNIAGSVALILFGIRFLRKGLERMLGHSLHAWLERMGRYPVTAALAGFVFGTVAPSSTAQTLLTLQLLNAGKLSAEAMLSFLLGANVGITVTVQLIALRFFDYYSLLLVAGFIGFQAFKSETIRGAGQSLLGLGFIFLAMRVGGEAAHALSGNEDFVTILGILAHHHTLLVLFSAVLTLATQSSTAAIGLALALGQTGIVSLEVLLPVVLGANLGLGLTSLMAGLGTWQGRRLAIANLVLKGAVIVVCLAAFPTVLKLTGLMPGSLERQTANVHTLFNLVTMVLGLACATPLGRLLQRTVKPAEPDTIPRVATHLDPAALSSPVFALANATRETLRLADEVKGMLEVAWRAFQEKNPALARSVQRHDDRIDELNTAIKLYLSRIPADALTPRDSQLQFGLLNFSSQLESIGDVIDKGLCGGIIEHVSDNVILPADEQADLAELYQRVLRRVETAISVLATRDTEIAAQFLRDGDALKEWCIAIQKRHYARLPQGDPAAAQASSRFIDTVTLLRRISGQLSTIGHTFVLTPAPTTE